MAGLALAASLIPGGASAEPERLESIQLGASAKGGSLARGPIGRPGVRGQRGQRGRRGISGSVGRRGPAGTDAAAALDKQFVSIAWQNGDYSGKDLQEFVAPGIGEGHVRCTPPNPDEQDGVQWVRFRPYDRGGETTAPRRWATTMWTQRVGGNVDDANHQTTNVTRTARLDRPNQNAGFFESLNTASQGYTPESIGSLQGLITTEPFDEGTSPPAPTSFRLSWHWNFRDSASARCYISATFVTEAG